MKHAMHSSPQNFCFRIFIVLLLAGASTSPAANLLVNPSFESPPSGQTVPTSWAYYAPATLDTNMVHDYWVANQTTGNGMPPHSGTFFWKQWTAQYGPTNNVAGIYQTFSSAPGSVYQASGWLASSSSDAGGLGAGCVTWIQVEFLDASAHLLALYKSPEFSSSVGLDTWFPFSATNACDLSSPISTGDPYFTTYAVTGSVSQLVAPPGTTAVRYRYAYLAVGNNEVGSALLDDAVLNQVSGSIPPVVSNIYPQNMIFVNPSDGISFTVSSPGGNTINNSGIGLVVNGVNVSGSLSISGTASSKNVSYLGLQSNLTYNVSITVTDAANLTASASTYFETTWVGVPPVLYLWEAEDFDFNSGMFINSPVLCASNGNPNCYFDKVGVEGTDEHSTSTTQNHFYRPSDAMGTLPSDDYVRKDHLLAGVLDYRIDPFNDGEWLNYTRNWSSGTYWVVGRLSTDVGLSGTLTLSVVNADSSTTDLGTFSINGGQGWSKFENVFLFDTNGNRAAVTFNGKSTLRVTSGGNLLPNFFMLVTATVDLPTLSNLYPTGTRPFEYTNALSFTVTTVGQSFPANSITVNLDGNDVTPNLSITGSTSVKNVIYPNLLPNAIHVAIIAATNSLGHGIRVTNSFDTFNEANYMVEAEDFDYNGGQYVDPWTPDAYSGFGATTNIDFQHTTLAGEQFKYRTDGIPEDVLGTHDYLRKVFSDAFATDYVLTFFAGNDWANYTRNYPAGSYYVYGRFSGGGPFIMYLDQVVSGAGTVNQTTQRLGQWSAVGKDYVTFDWVPLTDGGSAPVAINLNGVGTLRITTAGFCNPNFILLVPAAKGISLTGTRSGNNFSISFPTQAGVTYRVLYRTDFTSATWTLLTSVQGDGSVKSVTDPLTGTQRFYKVVAP